MTKMNNLQLIAFLLLLSGCVSLKKYEADIAELKSRPTLDLTDTDSDGIIDLLDQEKYTEIGCPVDTRGVTLDSDGDGIPDCMDREMYSPPGYKVDSDGAADIPDPDYISEADINRIVEQRLSQVKINVNSIRTPADKINSLGYPEFKIPPPPFSKRRELKSNMLFPKVKTYADIDKEIQKILMQGGYLDDDNIPRYHYYQIKMNEQFRGFAIVTHFEKINEEGEFQEDRFDLRVNKLKYKSVWDYIFPTKLNKGHFRLFAFLVTDNYFGQGKEGQDISKKEIISKLLSGATSLHPTISEIEISADCDFHILVYEYEQLESNTDGQPIELDIPVENHLSNAGISKLYKN